MFTFEALRGTMMSGGDEGDPTVCGTPGCVRPSGHQGPCQDCRAGEILASAQVSSSPTRTDRRACLYPNQSIPASPAPCFIMLFRRGQVSTPKRHADGGRGLLEMHAHSGGGKRAPASAAVPKAVPASTAACGHWPSVAQLPTGSQTAADGAWSLAQGCPLGPEEGPRRLVVEGRLRNRLGALPKAADSTLPLDTGAQGAHGLQGAGRPEAHRAQRGAPSVEQTLEQA